MKGFYIEISNYLLDPKHRKAMGGSVWLFMLLLDKMTGIDEKEIGKVLGGKPLKFEQDIRPELGISERTYNRWTTGLKKYGYINFRRTPYGLVFSINKAKKRFGRSTRNGASEAESSAKNDGLDTANLVKRVDKVAETKKTEQRQNNKTIQLSSAFDAFWESYPRKVAKESAIKAWDKILSSKQSASEIMDALEKHKKSDQWIRDEGRFIPYPATWLNQGRWKDEMKISKVGSKYENIKTTKI